MEARGWQSLSRTQRRLIVAVAVADTVAKAAMLRDLRGRPADRVRGPRWLWAATSLVGSAGLAPAAYFRVGRIR